ncbi:MAG TPA: C4-type zinc ribbon domain-containing protein [Opitutaceae bacterium]
MNPYLKTLLSFQPVMMQSGPATPEKQAAMQQLRDAVPEPILAHAMRLFAQGRKGVAVVRNGVCGGCHIRVPRGMIAALASSEGIHLCESCGCYLLAAPEEAVKPVVAPKARRVVRRVESAAG